MIINAYLRASFSRDGSKPRLLFEKQSDSLLQAFIGLLFCQMRQGTGSTVLNCGGSPVNPTAHAVNFASNAPSANSQYGILVGRDGTSVTLLNNKLGLQCFVGSGTNQLLHEAQVFQNAVYTASKCSFVMTRTFTNGSTATITLKECGIYCKGQVGAPQDWFCLARDSFTDTDVPKGYSITFEYELEILP